MVNVLEIPLYGDGRRKAVSEVIEVCTSNAMKGNRCVSATGAHGIVYAKKHPEFEFVLQNFFFNLPDGMPGVWIGRLKGAKKMDRCYGPDFFRDVMINTKNIAIRHYLCGGKEGVADKLKSACSTSFGNHNVVGTFCPPFSGMSDDECLAFAADVNSRSTDILWIGISTPKQEILAYRLAKYLNVHFIITVGAAFDFHIGEFKQAPKIFQKMGMEWFFRLCMEPRRLFKRYFEVVPLFIYYNIREFMRNVVKKGD
jgi:N-acetylglucosaminyldiphosphoundecaprenol N-acetyl-beta-D-mannosaminyltransferase